MVINELYFTIEQGKKYGFIGENSAENIFILKQIKIEYIYLYKISDGIV